MNGKTVMACIEAAHATLKEHTEEIAALDQQIGDGDHIFNLLRGVDALLGLRADIEAEAFAPALDLAASKLLSTVGGSSGPLFYSLLHGMAKASAGSGDIASVRDAARIFAAGVDAVAQRGKAGIGSKTMMDVLIPVASRLAELADDD
ncbi:DAK2 domain-containing protein, partial [Paraburkholderia sp. SIMBA_053]